MAESQDRRLSTAPDWAMQLRQAWVEEIEQMEPAKQARLAAGVGTGEDKQAEEQATEDWDFLQGDQEEEPDVQSKRYGEERAKFLSEFQHADRSSKQSSRSRSQQAPSSPKAERTKEGQQVYRRIRAGTGSFTEEAKPRSASGSGATMKDKFMSFISGEDEVSRYNRLRYKVYKQMLQGEIAGTTQSWKQHVAHREELAQTLQQQERQLRRWGLVHLIPPLRTHYWLRMSRAQLLGNMASRAIEVFRVLLEGAEVASQDAFEGKVDDSHFADPETMLLNDNTLTRHRTRLFWLDKSCRDALERFRGLLSELDVNPRPGKPRRMILINLLEQVQEHQEVSMKAGTAATDWVQFLCWYQKSHSQYQEFEQRFVRFIEDDREKEGRLFHRWVALAELITQQFLDKQAGKKPEHQKGNSSQPYVPARLMTPINVAAFARYFSSHVVGAAYDVPPELRSTLHQLTESVVLRKVHRFIFAYRRSKLKQLDKTWRRQCRRLRHYTPDMLSVPNEYWMTDKSTVPPPQKAERSRTESQDSVPASSNDLPSVLGQPDSEEAGAQSARSSAGAKLPGGHENADVTFQLPLKLPGRTRTGFIRRAKHRKDTPQGYGRVYYKACMSLQLMCSCVTTREIMDTIILSMQWLHREAMQISGSSDYLGADVLFPIIILVLVHSNIPCMHLILQYIRSFGGGEGLGEIAYYLTCIEAAVAFVMKAQVPPEIDEQCQEEDALSDEELERMSNASRGDSEIWERRPSGAEATAAMESLGAWLRDQQTMEDTITVLQQEGWMI